MPPEAATRPRWLIVGDTTAPEFGAWIRQTSRRVACESAVDAPFAASRLEAGERFDRVVALQARPAADPRPLERLAAAAEGADCVQALGVWCEGEARTGKPPKGWRRVFWHELDHERDFGEVDRGACEPRELGGRLVAIDCVDAETAEALSGAILDSGGASAWWPRGRGFVAAAAAGVWVGRQLGGLEADQLDAFCRRFGPRDVPVVALVDFPRPETSATARRIGAAALLGRPHSAEGLVAAIAQAISASVNSTSRRHRGS
jgi:hypothetical protein